MSSNQTTSPEIEYPLKDLSTPIVETENFKSKITKMKNSLKNPQNQASNSKKLIFLADYDDTFSRKFFNGKRVSVSYQVVTSSKLASEDLVSGANYLVSTYSPFERDTSIDFKIRDQKMYDYYFHTMELFARQKFNKNIFKSIVDEVFENGFFCFRNGVKYFFNLLKQFNLTLMLISAGVYEIIEQELILLLGEEEFNFLIDNELLIILANKLKYDDNNCSNGYVTPFIYTFNKNIIVNDEIKKLNLIDGEYSVIFFGDHMNDIDAASDLKSLCTLGVAFGNYTKDKIDKSFYKKYDVVVEGDGDFWYINNMVEDLMKNK